MWGLNWVDLVILGFLISSAAVGIRLGVVKQAMLITGFFATLFAAGWLFPRLLPIGDPTIKTIVNGNLVLIAALYAAVRCLDLGQKVDSRVRQSKKTKTNRRFRLVVQSVASLPMVATGLILVWLGCVAVSRLPFEGFSNSVRDSWISQRISDVLPPAPAVFATFRHQIDPNTEPHTFSQSPPNNDFNYSLADYKQAISKAEASVVRVTSFGCGGLATGSGFAVGRELVVTNAHVVAGVKRPIIKYQGSSYDAYPILFDTSLDFAILRTPGLTAPELELAEGHVNSDTTVAVLGYPKGEYRAAAGIIRENITLLGRNIYNVGVFGRNTYGVQTTAAEGSSGGPVVLADGRVAGMIFSKSDSQPNYTYAVASSYLTDGLKRTAIKQKRVSTGACLGI